MCCDRRRRGRVAAAALLFAAVLERGTASAQSVSSAAQGWTPFTIEKPPADLQASDAASLDVRADPRWRPRLPPRHDTLRTRVGVGYVWDRDWGVDLSMAGRVAGIDTQLNSFLTFGEAGVEAPSANLTLVDTGSGWGGEAGDVYTELRGLARGVRLSRSLANGRRPTVSLYLPNSRLHDAHALVAYRDEFHLFSRFTAGTEVASDGSYFVRGGYTERGFDLQVSHRSVRRDDPGEDSALVASYIFRGGVMLQAGLRAFESLDDSGRWRLFAVRVPIARTLDVTLEDNRTVGGRSEDVSHAVTFQLLRGPVRLTQRYQWGDIEYARVGDPYGLDQRQLQTAGSYSPTRWATVGLQSATQWLPDGRARQWQELHAALTLSRRSSLQVYASFPDLLDSTRFRGRFVQELPRRFSLLMDFGRVSAFQTTALPDSDRPRFSVMLRKTGRIPTPARGGRVSGRVVDETGNPVTNAGVRLGSYLTFTGPDGWYEFSNVPPGELQLRVANDLLPASYVSDGTSHSMRIEAGSRESRTLLLIPLNSIHGRVCHDVNGNGRCDAGEGLANMAVRLGDAVTATDSSGAYGFYNLQPGPYEVRLELDRPGETYAAASSQTISVELRPGAPLLGVDFRVAPKEKPTFLQGTIR
jgi:Carboxypeptidase regulatory-like domain/SdrD B-like domain